MRAVLPPLDLTAKCPKCGHDDVTVRWHDAGYIGRTKACEFYTATRKFGDDLNHMHRRCERCHYEWIEACADASQPTQPDARDDAGEALQSAGSCMATHPRDWGADRRDAWLWGLIIGWDDAAMAELVERYGWPQSEVERLKRLHAALQRQRGGDK
jgi:hypothetical protein